MLLCMAGHMRPLSGHWGAEEEGHLASSRLKGSMKDCTSPNLNQKRIAILNQSWSPPKSNVQGHCIHTSGDMNQIFLCSLCVCVCV